MSERKISGLHRRFRAAWRAFRSPENWECDCPTLDAVEVLCRVFDDQDAALEDWRAWYRPEEWLHPSRALGAFIWHRMRRFPGSVVRVKPPVPLRDKPVRLSDTA